MSPVDRRWILAGVLLAGGVGVARLVTARPKIRSSTRLLVVGDSMAVGLTPHLKGMATEQAVPYLALAKQGTRIDEWAQSAKMDAAITELPATLVMIVLGTNDAFTNYTPEQVAQHVAALLAKIPDGTDVLWVGAPALPATYGGRAPDPMILTAIQDSVKYYFPSHELEIPRGPDNLHPTAEGYAGWAGAIWDWAT
jgi:lysophospholipase L1-like esterase